MASDPELIAETREWLRKASEDLEVAQLSPDRQPPLLSPAGFHTQQAAEKMMKGFLTWHSHIFRKTHLLKELVEMCAEHDPSLRPFADDLTSAEDWAVEIRYPSAMKPVTREQVSSALGVVRTLWERLLPQLTEAKP